MNLPSPTNCAAISGLQTWNEREVAAALSEKRRNVHHWQSPPSLTASLAPPLFRMGYEWAALSIVAMLERILSSPSDEICHSQSFESVGRGLYRPVGKPALSDPRRRAAFDLIELIEDFGRSTQRGMFFVSPQRQSTYRPEDDAIDLRTSKFEVGLNGSLFATAAKGAK